MKEIEVNIGGDGIYTLSENMFMFRVTDLTGDKVFLYFKTGPDTYAGVTIYAEDLADGVLRPAQLELNNTREYSELKFINGVPVGREITREDFDASRKLFFNKTAN